MCFPLASSSSGEYLTKVHLLERPPITLINQGPKINNQQRKRIKKIAPFTPHHVEEEIASPKTPATYTNSRLELRQRKHRAMFRLSRTLKEKRWNWDYENLRCPASPRYGGRCPQMPATAVATAVLCLFRALLFSQGFLHPTITEHRCKKRKRKEKRGRRRKALEVEEEEK